jgi:hypothetical protein
VVGHGERRVEARDVGVVPPLDLVEVDVGNGLEVQDQEIVRDNVRDLCDMESSACVKGT